MKFEIFQLKKSVDTKTLVDFYYSEKNGIGGNWRLEHPDFPTKEELKAREEKMKSSNISIIRLDLVLYTKCFFGILEIRKKL